MDAPGILPARPLVGSLRRVLPSRLTRLAACALREVLTAGGQTPLLPSPPGAILGTVAHRLLEKAGRGEFTGWAKDRIYDEWDRLVAGAEARMSASWLDRHHVPLRQTYRNYAVRRIQACERAGALAASLGELGPRAGPSWPARRECEAWIETSDGLVGGFVDLIDRTAGAVLLRDYKSGSLEEPVDPPAVVTVKESYRVQMMLYAAIIREREGRWPARAELESLDGSAVAVIALEPLECLALLARAKRLLAATNASVDAVLQDPARNLRPLASPGAEQCRYCEFRPACEAYWETREANAGEWPDDIRGVVKRKTLLGIGTVMLEIGTPNGAAPPVRVRGLEPGRHPALAAAAEGERVIVCNLRQDRASGALSQTPLTAVYREAAEGTTRRTECSSQTRSQATPE